MRQRKLTVIVPLQGERVEPLRNFLQPIGDDIMRSSVLPIRLSSSTHFARFVILDVKGKARLLFSACYAGPLRAYIAELIQQCGAGLDDIFQNSPVYAKGDWCDVDRAMSFVAKHDVGWKTFVMAFPHAAPNDILAAQKLSKSLNLLLDDPVAGFIPALFPDGLKLTSPAIRDPNRCIKRLIEFVDRLLVGRQTQNANVIVETQPALVSMEDRVVQNQMTVFSANRPSVFRRLLLRFVLFAADVNLRISGSASSLPMIHFAQWSIVDGGDMLLFESNYDGSWEKYIDDFIDNSYPGLNAIWSNGVGYPTGGARNVDAFKAQIRSHQYPAQVFYSAYPDCTVQNNQENLALSDALRPLKESEAFRLLLSGSHAQRL